MPNHHAISAPDFTYLNELKARLQLPEPLGPDEQVELAAGLEAILGRAEPFDLTEIKEAREEQLTAFHQNFVILKTAAATLVKEVEAGRLHQQHPIAVMAAAAHAALKGIGEPKAPK